MTGAISNVYGTVISNFCSRPLAILADLIHSRNIKNTVADLVCLFRIRIKEVFLTQKN
jgi:hypothetical protein